MSSKSKYDICYWCGTNATSKEHVPPNNLFPKGHRIDLITVGACSEHNEDLSKLDERIRFYLTFVSNTDLAKEQFEMKALKGIKRAESTKLSLDLSRNYFPNHNGKNYQRDTSGNLDKFFEKIIRGLYFHHHKTPLKGQTAFFSNKVQHIDVTANVHFYFYCVANENENDWTQGDSKNEHIFNYTYRYSDNNEQFFLKMIFFEDHEVIGVTIPPNMSINDFGLEYEDYKQRMEKWL